MANTASTGTAADRTVKLNKPWAELERQQAKAAAVAAKAKATKKLNGLVPLTPDVNLIFDSTYSDVIA